MKNLSILIAAFFISLPAHAIHSAELREGRDPMTTGLHRGNPLPWQNIEVKQQLLLIHDLQLSERVHLKKGSRFTVTEVTALDRINVELYELSLSPCKGPVQKQKTEMKLIDQLYGVMISQPCKMEVYVELVDFSKPSFFTQTQSRHSQK